MGSAWRVYVVGWGFGQADIGCASLSIRIVFFKHTLADSLNFACGESSFLMYLFQDRLGGSSPETWE